MNIVCTCPTLSAQLKPFPSFNSWCMCVFILRWVSWDEGGGRGGDVSSLGFHPQSVITKDGGIRQTFVGVYSDRGWNQASFSCYSVWHVWHLCFYFAKWHIWTHPFTIVSKNSSHGASLLLSFRTECGVIKNNHNNLSHEENYLTHNRFFFLNIHWHCFMYLVNSLFPVWCFF